MTVRITETARGFHNYGRPVKCSYGCTATVRESSSAEGPHVWIFVDETTSLGLTKHDPGKASLHLNEKQARALIDRLQTWVDEIPSRWGKR